MKVFISSTCYDLVDLRAELLVDLRDLGVEPYLSDFKDSDFETSGEHVGNSIETCLANVRTCDLVVFVLSRRYGPFLKRGYGDLSATHVEYREARKEKKRIFFYIRDRLLGEWSTWKVNKRPDFGPTWPESLHDAIGLFNLIQEHQRLVGGGDNPGTNNWSWAFINSLDLRRRIAPQAYLATGEKLVQSGQAPILLVQGQGLSPFDSTPSSGTVSGSVYWRFTYTLVNAEPIPAIGVCCVLDLGVAQHGGASAYLSAVLPGDDVNTRQARTVTFDVPVATMREAFAAQAHDGVLGGILRMGYRTPTGHEMLDRSIITVRERGDQFEFTSMPGYHGKAITGMRSFL